MALAALSPKIKAGYRRAEITLDAARAFCIEQDHAKQDAVYRGMGKPITHAASVRANLMQGRMKASDRLARFVGLEAYESAGGALARDLFDADAVFVNDPALMARLADERLNSMREDLLAAGWGWVNINLGNGQFSGGAQRIHPKRREMTAEERKAKEDIDARIDALDEEMEDADSEDPRWEERDQLAACQHSVIDATLEWDRDLIAHAGVVISIDYEGRPSLAFGLVTKADQGKVNRILASRSETLPNQADADFPEDAGAPSEERPPWDDLGRSSPSRSCPN